MKEFRKKFVSFPEEHSEISTRRLCDGSGTIRFDQPMENPMDSLATDPGRAPIARFEVRDDRPSAGRCRAGVASAIAAPGLDVAVVSPPERETSAASTRAVETSASRRREP